MEYSTGRKHRWMNTGKRRVEESGKDARARAKGWRGRRQAREAQTKRVVVDLDKTIINFKPPRPGELATNQQHTGCLDTRRQRTSNWSQHDLFVVWSGEREREAPTLKDTMDV